MLFTLLPPRVCRDLALTDKSAIVVGDLIQLPRVLSNISNIHFFSHDHCPYCEYMYIKLNHPMYIYNELNDVWVSYSLIFEVETRNSFFM